MYLLGKPINDVTEADLLNLVNESVSESRILDYKLEFSGNGDGDKKEFLYDVAGMVNGGGGIILYGVEEIAGGIAAAIPGIALPKGLPDVILDLENKLRAGINPRVQGHKIDGIPLKNGKYVIYIAVPSSLNAPHMVTFKDTNKFYSRNSVGKYPMNVQEIRDMVLLSADLPEKMDDWVRGRLGKISLDQGIIPHGVTLWQAVHIVPASSISKRFLLESEELFKAQQGLFTFGGGDTRFRFNVEGSLRYIMNNGMPGYVNSYTQLFRTGQIESISTGNALMIPENNRIHFVGFEDRLIQGIENYLRILRDCGINTPLTINVTLQGFRGFRFQFSATHIEELHDIREIISNTVTLPLVWVNDWRDAENVGKLIRPLIDGLWNAVGEERSPNYDENGNWTSDPKKKAKMTLR